MFLTPSVRQGVSVLMHGWGEASVVRCAVSCWETGVRSGRRGRWWWVVGAVRGRINGLFDS